MHLVEKLGFSQVAEAASNGVNSLSFDSESHANESLRLSSQTFVLYWKHEI